jgi:hypothetical protein
MIITGNLPRSVKDYSEEIKLYLSHPFEGLIILNLDVNDSDANFYVLYSESGNRLLISHGKFVFNGSVMHIVNLINYY